MACGKKSARRSPRPLCGHGLPRQAARQTASTAQSATGRREGMERRRRRGRQVRRFEPRSCPYCCCYRKAGSTRMGCACCLKDSLRRSTTTTTSARLRGGVNLLSKQTSDAQAGMGRGIRGLEVLPPTAAPLALSSFPCFDFPAPDLSIACCLCHVDCIISNDRAGRACSHRRR